MHSPAQDRADSVSNDGAYATRPYERHLSSTGRKIVSIDLDQDLVAHIDKIRGNRRRGLQVDDLIRKALAFSEESMT